MWIRVLLMALVLSVSMSAEAKSSKPYFTYKWTREKGGRSYYVYVTTSLSRHYRLRCSFYQGGKHLLTMDVLTAPAEKGRMLVTGRVGSAFTRLKCKHT